MKERAKFSTAKERTLEKLSVLECCVRRGVLHARSIVFPILVIDAAIAACAALPFVAVCLSGSGEADLEIARECIASGATAVLSNDSDFLVLSVPKLVMFSSVELGGGHDSDSSSSPLKAFGCSSTATAASLKLPPALLPTLACLAGNDTVTLPDWVLPAVSQALSRRSGCRVGTPVYAWVARRLDAMFSAACGLTPLLLVRCMAAAVRETR